MGMRRSGLLGTRFTMEATFYPDVFERYGIEIVRPGDQDIAWVHEKYGRASQGSISQQYAGGIHVSDSATSR